MVFDPMQLFFGGACVLTLVAFLCPVCLTVLASAVLSYMVGAGVGLSLAVGPGIVVRALVSDHTLGWPNNAGPIWCVGIPPGPSGVRHADGPAVLGPGRGQGLPCARVTADPRGTSWPMRCWPCCSSPRGLFTRSRPGPP